MFDRRTIFALVVVVLILLLLPQYYKLITPPQPEPVAAPDSAQTTAPIETAAVEPETVRPVQPRETAAALEILPDTTAIELIADYIAIETPLYRMTLASNGMISGYELKEYVTKEGQPVNLYRSSGEPTGTFDFSFGSSNPKSINNLRFTSNKDRIYINSGQTDSLILVTGDIRSQSIILTYIFQAESYGFQLALQTSGLNAPETGEYRIKWLGGVPITEPDPVLDLRYFGSYAQVGSQLEKVTVGRTGKAEFQATGQTYFAAARSKYFMAAIIPEQPAAGVEIAGRNPNPKDHTSPSLYDLTLRQNFGMEASGRWTIYWGPIKYDNLKSLGVGLDETMNWGWQIIKPFSKGVLWSLTALHTVIPNYGLVIIIFSILVKIILWPLTRKSQVSMKKMASLQPEIKALKELHKNNPQAMNAAMMKLYKDRGVNPVSGCIPLLFQMPILYALFMVFSSTIEFRQAPFMLWISDLSLPDVIFHLPFAIPLYGSGVAVLPLVMGVTQFFMSKRTATDPNQKMMIYIMPVFMTLIFNQFPSGLTLYYTLFNVLAMVEQRLIKIPDFTPSATVIEEKKGKKKG